MSDTSQGDGWWIASDGKWYPPHLHPDYAAPPTPPSQPTVVTPPAQTVATPGADAAATQQYRGPDAAGSSPAQQLPSVSAPAGSGSGGGRKAAFALVGLVVLAGLLFVGWRLLRADDSAGGTEDPELAVQQLVTSINEADALGIATVLDPVEIDTFYGSFEPALAKLQELSPDFEYDEDTVQEIYGDILESLDIRMGGIDGTELTYEIEMLDAEERLARVTFDSLELSIESDAAPDTALVFTAAGQAGAFDISQVAGYEIELRNLNTGIAAELVSPDGTRENEIIDNAQLQMITVKRDGRWYISAAYSMIDFGIVAGNVDGRPDYGRAFDLIDSGEGGAATAQDAVRDLASSIERLDYEQMINLADPLSLPWLHDYQPLLDAEIDPRDLADAAAQADLFFDELDLSESPWNERTAVSIDRIQGRAADATFELETQTWCVTATSPDGERIDECLEPLIDDELLSGNIDIDLRANDILPETLAIVVVERNGRWYVDPMGTIGWYYEAVADVMGDVINEVTDQQGLGGDIEPTEFQLLEAPILRSGSVTVPTEGDIAAVAMALPDAPSVSATGVSLARVSSSDPAATMAAGVEQVELDSGQWVVVRDSRPGDEPALPAIVARTTGDLTVELVDTEWLTLTDELSGTFDGEGTPVILTVDRGSDYVIEGAEYQTFFAWTDEASLLGHDVFSTSSAFGGGIDLSFSDFVVIWGEPGENWWIFPESDDSTTVAPTPEPEPEPEGPSIDDPVILRFGADIAAPLGLDYSFQVPGGWFDGCGPDDPSATSYVYGPSFFRAVATSYDSPAAAAATFEQLLVLSSPCDTFPTLIVDSVEPGPGEVAITYSYEDDPTPYYEVYVLRDSLILTGVAEDPDSIEELAQVLRNFDG